MYPNAVDFGYYMIVLIIYCCDQKAWTTSVQSFTLWQQATTQITPYVPSIIVYSCHFHMDAILSAHSIRLFVVHHAFITVLTEWLQQHPVLFT